MDKTENRKKYLDYLRVISMISVLIIHVFTTAKTDFIEHTQSENYISSVIVQILHFCVPVFLMITGSIFLKESKEITLKKLYKKYICRYILVLGIFGYFFALLELIFNGELNLHIFIEAFIRVIMGKTWEHMWYIYMLIGLLILLPIIKVLVNSIKDNKENLRYFILIMFIINFIIPVIENIFKTKISIPIQCFSNYVLYLILGYYIDSEVIKVKKIKNIFFYVGTLVIVSLMMIVWYFVEYKNMDNLEILGGYSSPLVLMIAINIFLYFKMNKDKLKNSKIISILSENSFGIYILHMFWINIMYKFIKFNIYGNNFIFNSILVFIVILILSLLSTIILRKTVFKKIL